MNRAWIPAGALAGVSVAGLLALAPLTDSLGTQVKFEPSVPVSKELTKPLKVSVPVSVNLRTVGTVKTAAFKPRGGAAAKVSTSSDAGLVKVHVRPSTTTTVETQAPAAPATKAPAEPEAVKPKKVKRQTEIGGTTGVNGDSGLSGGNANEQGVGEQGNTPGG